MNPSRQRITLNEFITTIQNPSDILKAVSSSNDYIEELNSENAKSYFIQNPKQKSRIKRQTSHFIGNVMNIPHQTTPVYNQMAALILIIPVKYIPNEVFQWCSKLFPFLGSFPQIISAGLMMRFAESSLILDKVETTLQTMRWGINRYPFINCAYLYLCSASKNPVEYEIKSLTKYARVDCLTFYYNGINFLMLHNYLKAQEAFLHSLSIHSPSDFSKEIVSDLLLACFLNHYSENQARSLFSDKFEVSESVLDLFKKNDEFQFNSEEEDSFNFSEVFLFLINDINKEIRRRRVINLALTASSIPVEVFLKKTMLSDSKELFDILNLLKNEKIVSFRLNEDVITFSQPNLQSVIDDQYNSIMKSINQLKSMNQSVFEKDSHSGSNVDNDEYFF